MGIEEGREDGGRGGGGGWIKGTCTCAYKIWCVHHGPQKTGPKMMDHEGKEVSGNRGYKLVMIINIRYQCPCVRGK